MRRICNRRRWNGCWLSKGAWLYCRERPAPCREPAEGRRMEDRSSIYRERTALTLEHKPVDRCPIDIGGTPQSTVETQAGLEGLTGHLGYEGPAPAEYNKFDRRVLEHFDVDFRRAGEMVSFETPLKKAIPPSIRTKATALPTIVTGTMSP